MICKKVFKTSLTLNYCCYFSLWKRGQWKKLNSVLLMINCCNDLYFCIVSVTELDDSITPECWPWVSGRSFFVFVWRKSLSVFVVFSYKCWCFLLTSTFILSRVWILITTHIFIYSSKGKLPTNVSHFVCEFSDTFYKISGSCGGRK